MSYLSVSARSHATWLICPALLPESTGAIEIGSSTGYSQSSKRRHSFPQLFPPLRIPPNCYSAHRWLWTKLNQNKTTSFCIEGGWDLRRNGSHACSDTGIHR